MSPGSFEYWALIAAIIGMAVIGGLRAFTVFMMRERALQDVTLAADKLRREYDRRVRDMLNDSEVQDEGSVSIAAAQEAMEKAERRAAA